MYLRQAPPRKVIIVIAVVLAFSIAGILLTATWMCELTVPIMLSESLKITDVQFREGFVTVTVTVNNTGGKYASDVVTVTEVTVQPEQDLHDLNQTVILQKVPMSVPVHKGEQASISLSYCWVSGEAYQIRVTSSRGNYWIYRYAVAP